MNCGYYDEARSGAVALRAAAGKPEDLQIMRHRGRHFGLNEWKSWLPGYEVATRPMAMPLLHSFNWTSTAEVLDSIFQCRRHEVKPDSSEWWLESSLVRVESAWRKPDRSMWEIRDDAPLSPLPR